MPGSERYATYATAGPARFGATYEEHYDDEPEPFYPGERIGTSPRGGRRSRLPWFGIVTVITVCTGAVLFEEGVTSPQQVLAKGTAIFGSLANVVSQSLQSATAFSIARAPAPPPTTQPETPIALPPVEEKPVTQVAVVAPTVVNEPPPQAPSQEPDASPPDTAAPTAADAPLPKPEATTPNQKRAEAVGLHPGLSRALLTRLSKTDYRNARFAIKTALTKTPDNDVFVWPRKWEPKLAMFQVRFVRGAPANCRRYVVEIAKDGWLTTARPMEKCGVKVSGLARTN
jgi:hypothetical protein